MTRLPGASLVMPSDQLGFGVEAWPAAGGNSERRLHIGNKIKPNSSALFLLIRKVTGDKVLERLKADGFTGQVLQTSLTNEQEAALKKAMSDASAAA